ncbi:23S rRNA (uracil(1939)-C(5))-methyltransferase RlmD [Ferrimonas sediminicola]|uniref:23S rRNA (uracil(1939)-C(5))-methyltransferase RlmD n=1 Tax=Ferrimonas sediminicola TaxID=2569538 RepID=A0A4U1BEF1_9GAMM|nr:23S rRNA (uracil(1939)-C(5))-methyltransferase RlmD [Ferrimonas sediminicola]TKB49218.1 23S rRNA (uracil(1939)-C(5))-methyltransferase RlmD [Ferrimonas sediminicola]
MAQFFTAKSNKLNKLSKKITLDVQRLDHKGQGVANHQGKVVFIPGLLPGERGEVQLTEQKKRFAQAKLLRRLGQSPLRIQPQCQHFGCCGGCQVQHLEAGQQRAYKQQTLLEMLSRLGGCEPDEVAEPLFGSTWHYRRRARLALRVERGELRMGFRREGSSEIEPVQCCPILVPPFDGLLPEIHTLLSGLKGKRQLGHLELTRTAGESLFCLRVLKPLQDADCGALAAFARKHGLTVLLDDGDAVTRLDGKPLAPFAIELGEMSPPLAYLPGDFIQVNGEVNQAMVAQALEWLAPRPQDQVLELFAGIGNFSFPLARRCRSVLAVEGVSSMVARGNGRARELGLDNLSFCQADLNDGAGDPRWLKPVDLLLLDPARAGAGGALAHLGNWCPRRVLYVSCNPASLARDAKMLTEQGYRLKRVGLVDMFPHTQHLESMALFEKSGL